MRERVSSPPDARSSQENAMSESSRTPSTAKSAIKADQYVPPPKAGQPAAEKADQPEATKTGRSTAVKADQPVPRLMTVTITIDADSAEVVRVEGVDASGARHELSDEEKTNIIKERRDERLAELVEQAFEAGIASVLGVEEGEEETTQESPEDTEFRRQLLAPLIERSAIRRLTERAALNRAMLGTLIEHSLKLQ
jgi:hypothetical protein